MERHQKRVYLDLNYVFGSNCYLNLRNSLSFIEQDEKMKIVYTAGKTIVKKCLATSQMEFIKLSDNIDSIQCLSISPTRNHIAICEKIKNENFILLNLYGLKTKDSEIKHFKLPQTQKQSTFKMIAFAPSQPKYACCLTGEPEHQLIFLDISRSRGLAVSNFPVANATSLAISPTQSHIISVCGKGFFRLFKVEDYSFKANQDVKKLPKNRNFTIQSWFDKTKILLGTDRGELFIVGPVGNNYEVKRNYANVFNEQQLDLAVNQIGVLNKGFILGSNKGHFSLWLKKQENQDNFQDEYAGEMVKTWKVPQAKISEVTSIAICPKQEHIGVGFKNNSIALINLSKLLDKKQEVVSDEELFDFLHDGFHQGPISTMDICLHRPIIATLSKSQKTIRLWNYKKPRCELIKKFDSKIDGIEESNNTDMLTSLAIHPFGYYMAVGFCDKLRIYHILLSTLRSYREIVLRGVCQLKFSNGGDMLAAAYSKQKYSIHLINVYNSYTLEEIARLSDHSNIITQLCWKPDDKALYSVGADGFIAQWKYEIKPENKEWPCRKWSQPNAKYTSGIYERSSKSFLSAGQESGKNVIREYRLEKEQAQKIYTMGFKICKLQWLNSQWNIPAIIAGTDGGAIKVFNSPYDNIVEQTLNVHLKEITKIQTSPCGRYVFSVGQDFNIFIFQVSLTNREGFISKRLHDQVTEYELNPLVGVSDDELADIVLVQRNTVNEKIRYIKLLQKNLEDMKNKIVMQDDESSKKHKAELVKLESMLTQRIQALNMEFEILKKDKKQIELQTQTYFIDTQGNNIKMLQQIEALFEKKLTLENQKYFQLQKTFTELRNQNEVEILKTKKDIRDTLDQLKNDFVDTFRKAEKVHTNKQREVIEGQKMYNEKVSQIQEQHEEELKRINKKINELLKQKDVKNAEFLTKIESFNREIKILREEIVDYMSKNERLSKYIFDAKRELGSTLEEIREKNEELKEKQEQMKIREEKIGEFQERIGDLQKKKQILSYRTWEMRQEVEPKEDQIQFLKQELFSLETQFENLLKDEKNLKQNEIMILKEKERMNKKIKDLKGNLKQKQLKIKRLCDEINAIVQSKSTDKRYYEQKMVELYNKYVGMMTNSMRINQNSKGNDEMIRHISHLKNEIVEVNDKTNQGLLKRDEDLRKATTENKDLILELTRLREMRLKFLEELKNSTKVAENLKRQINQVKNGITRAESPVKAISKKESTKEITHLPSLNKTIARSASGPIKKGKVLRGNNFDGEKLANMTKARLADLEERAEILKMDFKQKQLALQMMKTLINEHIVEYNCADPMLIKSIQEYDM